ncbi:cytochrome P450 family protein [Rhizoctonia solani 123E]|uniref:Cytochrome P450 family protein n=1 Tax=Rhizoctonia solani 123E TaxID=1423351 RepID=A0A074RP39_9AGAM|nr:cytochrome P450 family protein [Rhizoctonia solani 123E]
MDWFDIAILPVLAIAMLPFVKSSRSKPPLPPSPKSYPLLGNIPVIPEKDEHVAYRDWSRELNSDIIHIKVPGHTLIILNSARAMSAILERSSNAYLNRPSIPLIDTNLFDLTRHTAFLPYGERWKHQRRLMHLSLRKSAMPTLFPIQTKHARQAAAKILEQPEDYIHILGRMLGSQILSCVYGYEVTSPDDEMIKLAESASFHVGQAVFPLNFLVNVMPQLKRVPSWIPGAGWKAIAREWSEEFIRTISLPYEYTVAQMVTGTAVPSVLAQILNSFTGQGEEITDEQKDRAMWTAGSVFTAAVESLHGVLQIVVLLMTIHQDVQHKAQKEIDKITEGKRLPEMSDMQGMPYTRSIILETLRWIPVSPMSIPRLCGEDDTYNGYTIPKGALVIGNIWAINRDETRYDDPETFLPERFMDPSTPEPVTFGFGRRICPGIHFAHPSLFINVATILSGFNIRPAKNERGEDIIPKAELVPGALAFNPVPFECTITPRSELHRQLLVDSVLADWALQDDQVLA